MRLQNRIYAVTAVGMDQQEAIAEIEREARRAGFSIAALCKRADIHPSTYWRWKKTRRNPKPTNASYSAIVSLRTTLKEMIAERDAGEPRAAWA